MGTFSAPVPPPIAPQPRSAVDVISPAFQRMRRLMFPIKWSRWWRLAIIGLITGEMNSCSFGSHLGNFQFPSGGGKGGQWPFPNFPTSALITFLIIFGALVLVWLVVHLYLASVLRFAMFDTVAMERFSLRRSWRIFHAQALRYFGFSLLVLMITLTVLAGIVVFAVLLIGRHPGPGAILLVVLMVFVVLFASVIWTIILVLIKDFTVPILALENVGMTEALRRLRRMIAVAPGSYAGYIGMKIVIAIPVGIVFAIINFIVLFILAIPAIIAIIALVAAAPHAFESPGVIALAATIGVCFLFFVMFVMAVINAPVVTFFQSYVLEFFGDRYEPLGRLLHPVVPSPAPTPAAAPLPEPPPVPSPA